MYHDRALFDKLASRRQDTDKKICYIYPCEKQHHNFHTPA
jgi:hypothetical protein